MLVLGLPTLAMAFSTTAVSTYLPVLARRFTGSATVIGVIIAGEGLMALFVPLLSGAWSDRFRARGGSRLAFVLAGVPLVVLALAPLGLVASLPAMAVLVALFFGGNFFSYEPYRALYPDTLPQEIAGRGQATQAVWRGAGTVLALAGGGLLLSVWHDLPFLTAACMQAAAVAALALLLPRVSKVSRGRNRRPALEDFHAGLRDVAGRVRKLLKEQPELRLYMIANCLWELSLGALKTFIVLYVTEGLHRSLSAASLIIGGVAVIVLLGAVASGKLGDRYGAIATMRIGLLAYGVALIVPALTHSAPVLLPFVPLIAFGGGLVMTLPYAILIPVMPKDSHGILTGFYSLSRGMGVMLGPLLAGVAIQLLKGPFASTHGYAAMWLVTSGSILLSVPALGRLGERRRASGAASDRPRRRKRQHGAARKEARKQAKTGS
jgi:MFS family permease